MTPRKLRFNPRPRTGGDAHGAQGQGCVQVSIRAPARGATRTAHKAKDAFKFQSAPPHGGRRARRTRPRMRSSFNPRPRTGGDAHGAQGQGCVQVSIRAPARGATRTAHKAKDAFKFQSAPPHGGRPTNGTIDASRQTFQSAPPHGGRPTNGTIDASRQTFQSAPPHGGRPTGRKPARARKVFQSAPPHGGRQPGGDLRLRPVGVSIRAPARGATPRGDTTMAMTGFNPRPRTGGDPGTRRRFSATGCFNPRPRTGGDAPAPRHRRAQH